MKNKEQQEARKKLKRNFFREAMIKEYVKEKVRSALWLIKSIQNRQRTIIKVANAIIGQQRDFFKKGPAFLRPMVLRDVAEEIGMHESTVSRVTTNKYIHTPIGTFELKYFFSSSIGKEGGNEIITVAKYLFAVDEGFKI